MTSAAALAVSDLPQRIRNLPQELFDHVFDLVFEGPPDFTVITQDWTPPPQLHVSRTSRHKFATQYYGKGTFHFHDPELLARWFATMTFDHRSLLKRKRRRSMFKHRGAWLMSTHSPLQRSL